MPTQSTTTTITASNTTAKCVKDILTPIDSTKEEIVPHKSNKENDRPTDSSNGGGNDGSNLPTSIQTQGATDQSKKVHVACGVIPYGEVAEMETTGLV